MKNLKYNSIVLVFVFVVFGFVSTVHAISIGPDESYNPQYTAEDFTTVIDNPYFSLPVGKKMVYESQTEDGVERIEILVPGWTRTVDGVETLVFWDRVYLDGELIEDTRDYIAQHKQTGDIWYFGEHVDNYEDGIWVDHDGAWLTGVDGAKAGMWVLGSPQVGDTFRNEYLKGEAEDESKITSTTATITTPLGIFTNCVESLDGSPLFEATAHTYYCKQVAGTVLEIDLPYSEMPQEQRVELVDVQANGAFGIALPAAYAKEGVVDSKPTGMEKEDADGSELFGKDDGEDVDGSEKEDRDYVGVLIAGVVGLLAGLIIGRHKDVMKMFHKKSASRNDKNEQIKNWTK